MTRAQILGHWQGEFSTMAGTSYAEIPFTVIKIALVEGQSSIKTMALSSTHLGSHDQPCHEGSKVDVQSLIRTAFNRQDLYCFFGEVSCLIGQDNRHILLNDLKPGITCQNRYYKNVQVLRLMHLLSDPLYPLH